MVKDKTKYDRKSESEKLQDDLEPIMHDWEDEGGSVHPEYIHPTEYDESNAERIIPPQPEKPFQPFNGGKGG